MTQKHIKNTNTNILIILPTHILSSPFKAKHTHFKLCATQFTQNFVRFRCHESILSSKRQVSLIIKYIIREEQTSQIRGNVPNPSWKASCMNFEGRTIITVHELWRKRTSRHYFHISFFFTKLFHKPHTKAVIGKATKQLQVSNCDCMGERTQ